MEKPSNRPSGMFAFTIVWLGQIISVLASSMSQFALTIFMYEKTQSATAMGLMQVFYFVPFLLVSPLAGVMVDRHNRKTMMMISDLGAGLATVCILILQALGILQFWRPKPLKDETYDHITFGSERVNADARRFLPHFVLSGKVLIDGKYETKEDLDRLILVAQIPIQNREVGGKKLYNSVEICRVPVPLSDDQNDRSIWGVATWEDLDPRMDFFSIYVQGLTNAYQFKDTPGAYQVGETPGKGRAFVYKTLQLNFHRAVDSILEHEEEIHYGAPLDSKPGEQARLLGMYGIKEPPKFMLGYEAWSESFPVQRIEPSKGA